MGVFQVVRNDVIAEEIKVTLVRPAVSEHRQVDFQRYGRGSFAHHWLDLRQPGPLARRRFSLLDRNLTTVCVSNEEATRSNDD